MLADAKLPVTFWAESVNTACYVQNRVLVNKSHNKTPYELFNGRSPAIGFLKPFGCHVMILNTLDNLGKFEEKGMKAHDALLEFSSSKPQDHCNTKVPEGSGNTNPTAYALNPPADHMETLIVESSIPTVSSPVPTTYSTNSQEPSNILGGTTISDESNGEEADISNMKTVITASPTPTLRIHKDHPKSQIIGHVDTPIQTRNKSKEVGEQSFIATIHQKTDPALLQFCLFSCFLS
nr:ribonuclease H-like domain-containing protein [Tanacetum cinerariifolium]